MNSSEAGQRGCLLSPWAKTYHPLCVHTHTNLCTHTNTCTEENDKWHSIYETPASFLLVLHWQGVETTYIMAPRDALRQMTSTTLQLLTANLTTEILWMKTTGFLSSYRCVLSESSTTPTPLCTHTPIFLLYLCFSMSIWPPKPICFPPQPLNGLINADK